MGIGDRGRAHSIVWHCLFVFQGEIFIRLGDKTMNLSQGISKTTCKLHMRITNRRRLSS